MERDQEPLHMLVGNDEYGVDFKRRGDPYSQDKRGERWPGWITG